MYSINFSRHVILCQSCRTNCKDGPSCSWASDTGNHWHHHGFTPIDIGWSCRIMKVMRKSIHSCFVNMSFYQSSLQWTPSRIQQPWSRCNGRCRWDSLRIQCRNRTVPSFDPFVHRDFTIILWILHHTVLSYPVQNKKNRQSSNRKKIKPNDTKTQNKPKTARNCSDVSNSMAIPRLQTKKLRMQIHRPRLLQIFGIHRALALGFSKTWQLRTITCLEINP